MKKIILGYSMLALLFSCAKTNPNPANDQFIENGTMVTKSSDPFSIWYSENYHRLDEVTRAELLSFDDIDLRRQIYSVLPSATTKQIWLDKYENFLTKYDLSSEQLQFINSVITFIESSEYRIPLTETGENLVNSIYQLGQSLFNKDMLYITLVELDNPDEISASGGGASGILFCNCSTRNNWCGVLGGPNTCRTDLDCSRSSSGGCGFLLLYDCNGKCGAVPVRN